ALLLPALSGCAPTEGNPEGFEPLETTDTYFDPDPLFTPAGNFPHMLAHTETPAGVLDYLAVGARLDNLVNVFQNDGAGNLSLVDTLVTGSMPGTILLGDLDGSGPDSPDAVVIHSGFETVSVYLSQDGTSWAAPVDYPLNNLGYDMQLAEIGNGGLPEILISIPGDSQMAVFLNNGAGSFTPVYLDTPDPLDDTLQIGPQRFAAADLNADSLLDLAVVHPSNNLLSVWLGDGTGGFTPAATPSYETGGSPEYPLLADLGNDALAEDLLVSNRGETTVSPLLAGGSGEFTVGEKPDLSAAPSFCAVLDLDPSLPGLDIVALHKAANLISILHNDSGTFTLTSITTNKGPAELAAADWNSDGNLDLAVTEHISRSVSILTGDGAGGFTSAVIGFSTLPARPLPVDANGDLKPDLLVLHPNEDRLALLLNVSP
ncbi:MAG: VCBS repeat-containing protein, partial [Deltaproteobacteria bacterium]|nr:VCBS repeat-containing protein [Deltaproteobacteria bacterium]